MEVILAPQTGTWARREEGAYILPVMCYFPDCADSWVLIIFSLFLYTYFIFKKQAKKHNAHILEMAEIGCGDV